MKSKFIWSTFFSYSFFLLIFVWWAFAFRSSPQTYFLSHSETFDSDREALKEALQGNFLLIGQLISKWDLEAEEKENAKRLPPEQIQRALFLSSSLKKEPMNFRILPQSYAAASILLAISHPCQIAALPQGLRKQVSIFPKQITDRIPLEIDRFNSEKLSLKKPDIALVSSYYSHPATIEALRNQKIQIVFLKTLDNIAAIKESITDVGKYGKRPEEAELLNLFIDASLMAIDNWRLEQNIPRFLYVNAYTQMTTASKQTFTYEQLCWLGQEPEASSVIDRERLYAINPEKLIISTMNKEAICLKLAAYTGLQAVQNGQVCFLDDEIQQSATQFAVLAYYDLVHAVVKK